MDHAAIIEALQSEHFTQPAVDGRLVHFVKVDGRPTKIVTGLHHTNPDVTAIITLVPLDVETS